MLSTKAIVLAFLCLALCLTLCLGKTLAKNPSSSELAENDNLALNYALTLEHLESAFYKQLIGKYKEKDFTSAGYQRTDYNYFQLIAAHESAHVSALISTIEGRGGTAVKACTYDFNALGKLTSLKKYVSMARVLENTGVSAYDGAVNKIYDKGLLAVAASIATVEARHASYLNDLNNKVPFPDDFDVALNGSSIVAIISPLLKSCPQKTVLPEVLIVMPVKAPKGQKANPTSSQLSANDLVLLNYALTLEHLEATFYAKFQKEYSSSDFTKAGYDSNVHQYLNLIRDHEAAHVSALTSTIKSLGGKPVPACTYDFSSVKSVKTYLSLAAAFEGVGQSAYDGAINTTTNLGLRQVAATIATVEGRHAAYLNLLTRENPFPESFDTERSPSQVLAVISPTYVKKCPYTIQLPKVLVVKPYNKASSSSSAAVSAHAAPRAAYAAGFCLLLAACFVFLF